MPKSTWTALPGESPDVQPPCALKFARSWPACQPLTGTACAARSARFCATNSCWPWRKPAASAAASGWDPCHLLLRDDARRLAGAMPLYRKTSSYGEFVFDWAWADAYRRAGLRYFPKLVSAVPFTPATSPRLLFAPDQNAGHASAAALLARRHRTCPADRGLIGPRAVSHRRRNRPCCRAPDSCRARTASSTGATGVTPTSTRSLASSPRRSARRPSASGVAWRKPASVSFACSGGEIDAALWKQADAAVRQLVLATGPRALPQ